MQVVDVTPRLDKSFSPATVPTGATSRLTLTVSVEVTSATWGTFTNSPAKFGTGLIGLNPPGSAAVTFVAPPRRSTARSPTRRRRASPGPTRPR